MWTGPQTCDQCRLECVEGGRVSGEDERGWTARLTIDDEVVVYSNAHRQAVAALERAVLEGTLRPGGDPAVSQQLLAAAADRFDNGDVRRLRKLDPPARSTRRWRCT
jgi:hypothetical protein